MIYFIKMGSKFVKIGVSDNPELRLKGLQTSSPLKLKLLLTMPGDFKTEAGLHEVFAKYKTQSKNEWFRFVGELEASIHGSIAMGAKHPEVKTIHQLLENGHHFRIRQKKNRNPNFAKKFNRIMGSISSS